MSSTGYIQDGVYYRKKVALGELKDNVQSTHKDWGHDRQRESHRFDLIQPYQNGRPNPEFIEHYPEESKNYGFIKEGDLWVLRTTF